MAQQKVEQATVLVVPDGQFTRDRSRADQAQLCAVLDADDVVEVGARDYAHQVSLIFFLWVVLIVTDEIAVFVAPQDL